MPSEDHHEQPPREDAECDGYPIITPAAELTDGGETEPFDLVEVDGECENMATGLYRVTAGMPWPYSFCEACRDYVEEYIVEEIQTVGDEHVEH